MISSYLFQKKGSIPRTVILFLVKGLLLFVLWKSVYLLALKPQRVLDDPLTRSVGSATVGFLNFFSAGHPYSAEGGMEDVVDGETFAAFHVVKIYRNKT